MAGGEPTHNLVIHYKTNRYIIKDVHSNTYTHLEMLSDVSDLALRDVPSSVSIYITLTLPIPGTGQTMEVQNDADLKTMFELHRKTRNVHILLKVSENPPLVPPTPGPQTNWLALDDVRTKGKKVAEVEDGLEEEEMKVMADRLLHQIKRSDGYEAGFRCDYKRDLRLQRAAILKRMGGATREKVESVPKPVGDDGGIEY